MAPKWYQAPGPSWWGWSYVADLGPYSGPVPPSYPLWVPDAAAELDFVVGIPHPSGDPRLFRDGSYSAGGFSGSYAYHFAPGPLDGTGAYGGTSLEAGDHLFVQFYFMGYPFTGTLPPKMPALSLVPSTLIAGGYGPTIGSSHWSAWQEGELHQATAASSALAGTMRTGVAAANGFVDCRPVVQAARANIDAGSGAGWTLPNGASGIGYQEQSGGYPLGYFFEQEKISTAHPGTRGTAQIAMTGASFDATAGASYRNPLPSVLSGLTEGVDYIADPVTGDFAVYDSGADSTFQGWNDWQIDSRAYSWQANSGAFVNPSTVRIKVKDGVASPGWVATSDSSWSDVGGISFPTDIQSGIGSTTFTEVDRSDTFSLGVLTQPTYSVMAMPELADSSSALGLADIPSGDLVQDGHYMNMSLNGPTRTVVLWMEESETQPQFQDANWPVGVWKQPRWRYLIPGSLEFHCPGGARPRITVTEGHWSDWIEGDLVTPNTSYRIHPQGQWDENLFTESYSTSGVFGAPPPPGGTLPVAWPDIAAYMDSELAGARAGTLARFDGADNAGIDLSLFKRLLYSGGPSVTYQEWVGSFRVFQDVATYDASSLLVGYDSDYYGYFARHGISNYGPNPITGLIYDGESSTSTVLGWEDWDSTLTTIGDAPSWQDFQIAEEGSAVTYPPPSSTPISMPFLIRASSAPLAPTTDSYSLDSSLHFLDSSDGALLTTVTLPATGGSSSITIPLSDLGPVPGFTIFFRPQLLESGSIPFGDPTMPSSPYTWSRESRVRGFVKNLSFYTFNDIDPSTRGNVPIIRIRRPRWRYWIPALTDIQCEQAVLRLGQRNDGRGPYAHPRLDSSQSAPSSVQRSAAPRLGSNNRYQ